MIPGVILAAGWSSRMGTSKALLRAGPAGQTFLRQLAGALLSGGVADVLVVGRPEDEPLAREVAALSELGTAARFIVNPRAAEGQLSSMLAGLNAADKPGVTGILVAPVDAPLIRSDTVSALLAVFRARGAPIVRATYRGRHGHPVIFGRAIFNELRRADPEIGAKMVVRAHQEMAVDVDLDDPAVLHDIDSPEDYERVFNDAR
jgi:molybdenum cofactor cytidylyltransferase